MPVSQWIACSTAVGSPFVRACHGALTAHNKTVTAAGRCAALARRVKEHARRRQAGRRDTPAPPCGRIGRVGNVKNIRRHISRLYFRSGACR